MRQYKNFDEIDRDLKLLKLQQDIQKEEILLNVNRTKESLALKAILKGAGSGMMFKGAQKILSLFIKKK